MRASVEKRRRNLKRTVKNSVMMKQKGMKAARRNCDSIVCLASHAGHVRKGEREMTGAREGGRRGEGIEIVRPGFKHTAILQRMMN